MHDQNWLSIFKMTTKTQKDVYITQSSGITPRSQIEIQSKAYLKSGTRNTWRKLKFPSKIWHLTIRKEIQWSESRKITRFKHSLKTSRIQQFEPCIKHHKLIHSHLIKYACTYIFVQCLTRCRSSYHTMPKQRKKIYSVQGKELTQESNQTQKSTVSKRRSHSKSSSWIKLILWVKPAPTR